VLALDPSLIPNSCDVVIGEDIYELHFKVESEEMQDNPRLLEMDDDSEEPDIGEEEGTEEGGRQDYMQEDNVQRGVNDGGNMDSYNGSKEQQGGQKNKKVMHYIHAMPNDMEASLEWEEDEETDDMGLENCDEIDMAQIGQEVHTPVRAQRTPNENVQRELMAAIPEAMTHLRRSKRRADTADQSSLEQAEKIKAARNLDPTPKSNKSTPHNSLLQFINEQVVENLSAVGISLGNSTDSIGSTVACVKEIELQRLQTVVKEDKINSVFDKEEKEEQESEEIDKLILNSLCSEIMDKVVDLGNAYRMDCNVTLRYKTSSSPKISTNQGVNQRKSVQNERSFLELSWVQGPKETLVTSQRKMT
jgi:hypothetical protein